MTQFSHDRSLADPDTALTQGGVGPEAPPSGPRDGHPPGMAPLGGHPHGLAALHDAACGPAAACYAAGTLISTVRGEVAVERLRAGDVARLADGGTAPVTWVGHRRARAANPVRVLAGAFGPGLPRRDLVLSPEHALFLGGHLVPAHVLVDGVAVLQEHGRRVTYCHVELDRHAVLFAEGLPAESYLDTGNRSSFANAVLVAFEADFGPGAVPADACAPIALDGPVVEDARSILRQVAQGRAARVA